MPYILDEDRHQLLENGHTREAIGVLLGRSSRNGGDMQYMLAVAMQAYMAMHGLSYANCEALKGALHGAIDEFHDKIVEPYEREKEHENGGVYDLEKLHLLKDMESSMGIPEIY